MERPKMGKSLVYKTIDGTRSGGTRGEGVSGVGRRESEMRSFLKEGRCPRSLAWPFSSKQGELRWQG